MCALTMTSPREPARCWRETRSSWTDWPNDPVHHPAPVPLAGGAGHGRRCRRPHQGGPGRPGRFALHAPQAGFGDEDFYPDLYDKAAVLTCRLAWNHPLPDGNKRAAWAALVMFIDLNGGTWDPNPPDVDAAEPRCSGSRPCSRRTHARRVAPRPRALRPVAEHLTPPRTLTRRARGSAPGVPAAPR